MSRKHVLFACEGSTLVGTLDTATGSTATGEIALLIVSGGNELRYGPWGSQSGIAATLATQGYSVFRFDRRGVGDSEGPNLGFRHSGPDIAAALTTLRAQCPHVRRVIAYGNCDAASALMLTGGAGLDGMVLANPWTFDEMSGDEADDDETNKAGPVENQASPATVRAHYRQRLTDPAALRRLLTGKVSLSKLFGSLRRAAAPAATPSLLARDMARGLASFDGPVRILIAGRDRTGQEFLAQWSRLGDRRDSRIATCPPASHSFVEPEARGWLLARLKEVLTG